MRGMPTKISEIESGNNWIAQTYTISTLPDFDANLMQVKAVQAGLIGHRSIMGYKIGVMIANWLPFGVAEYFWQYITNKTTFNYSNFPGPRNGYNFGGVKCNDMTGFAPMLGW